MVHKWGQITLPGIAPGWPVVTKNDAMKTADKEHGQVMKERWKGKGGANTSVYTYQCEAEYSRGARGWVGGVDRTIWDFHVIVPRSAAWSRPYECVNIVNIK